MSDKTLDKALAEVLAIPQEEVHLVCAYNEEKIRELTGANND